MGFIIIVHTCCIPSDPSCFVITILRLQSVTKIYWFKEKQKKNNNSKAGNNSNKKQAISRANELDFVSYGGISIFAVFR